MKPEVFFACCLLLSFAALSFAEDKYGTAMIIPKLSAQETADAPILSNNHVFPEWGVPCTNYTYYVTYTDSEGRAPEYMRIWYNGEWLNMKKASGDYKTGAVYQHNIVPNSGKSNFYYFEASNGVGKARAAIIDSPDQGPMIYSSKFENNQIILLKKDSNVPVWVYPTGKELPTGVALSKDGKYLAASTPNSIYLFSTGNNEPQWRYCQICKEPPMPTLNSGGVAISADGRYVAGMIGQTLYYFENKSKEPVWSANTESNAIGIDMSDDGQYIAVGTGNSGDKGDTVFFFNNKGELLWKYKAEHPGYIQTGNFYRPDITPNGDFVAVSTGCPDRRAYMFSTDGTVIFRTEQLTMDSPVHKSAISDDGSLAAYSLDHMQGKEIVMLFSNSGKKLWGFSSSEDGTARAVSMSADGNYIAAGTTGGHIYLFSKASGTPRWKFTATSETKLNHIGDVKLSRDGQYLVGGGTGKQLYFFSTSSSKPLWTYSASEWIAAVDIESGYVAAVTGMHEYMFEGNEVGEAQVSCQQVIQPISKQELQAYYNSGLIPGGGTVGGTGVCGNMYCEPDFGETFANCPNDCGGMNKNPDVLDTPIENDCTGDGCLNANGPTRDNITRNECMYDDCRTIENVQADGTERYDCGNQQCELDMGETHANCPDDCEERDEPMRQIDNRVDGLVNERGLPPQQPAQAAAQPALENENEKPECSGIIADMLNFLYSLIGNKYCN